MSTSSMPPPPPTTWMIISSSLSFAFLWIISPLLLVVSLMALSAHLSSSSNVSLFVYSSLRDSDHGHYPTGALLLTTPPLARDLVGDDEGSSATPPEPESNTNVAVDLELEKLEFGLAKARAAIRAAAAAGENGILVGDGDYIPQGPVYRNPRLFHRSYLEMEKVFRVFVYSEGEPPLFHEGPCRSIYSSEGRFIHTIRTEDQAGGRGLVKTRDPWRAHVFFLPFSVVEMVRFVYQHGSYDIEPIKRTISDYVHTVAGRYPFWNRSNGADHFMLSCHDWGPHASSSLPQLQFNSIRVLCNANKSEGFDPKRDVSLPEINLQTGLNTGIIGGPSPSGRPLLAFFAGGNHGPIRPQLLHHWKGRDADVEVHDYLPHGVSYYSKMRSSRFCICPSGYEVASPRVVEAIYLECVPVIISDGYELPFSDVLNWRAFSVRMESTDIPRLKEILQSISPRHYIRMYRRLKVVQRHFVMNTPPKRYDVYHMILHSVWLRRLNVRIGRRS